MRFQFYNLNPLNKLEQDCVCRAITLATNEDYDVILNKLQLVGDLFDCDKLCVDCYKFLLDNVYNFDRIESYHGHTINEFLKHHSRGVYIIRIDRHLTCAIDGKIYDTWDCSDEIIDIIWTKEK